MANLALFAIDYDGRLLPEADDVDVFVVNVSDLLKPPVARGSRYRAVAGGIKAKDARGRGFASLASDFPVALG